MCRRRKASAEHEIYVWGRPWLGLLGKRRWCLYAAYASKNDALTEWFWLQHNRRYHDLRMVGPGYSTTIRRKP